MQVAGWVGLWVAAVAFYDATAILTAEVYDHVSAPANPYFITLALFRG